MWIPGRYISHVLRQSQGANLLMVKSVVQFRKPNSWWCIAHKFRGHMYV